MKNKKKKKRNESKVNLLSVCLDEFIFIDLFCLKIIRYNLIIFKKKKKKKGSKKLCVSQNEGK